MRLIRLYHTLRPLRWQQYWYRAINPIRKIFYRQRSPTASHLAAATSRPIAALYRLPVVDRFDVNKNRFTILAKEVAYDQNFDWDNLENGLLWAYHLNYFGWLEDDKVPTDAQTSIIVNYVVNPAANPIGSQPYPTSLRSIAWIRYMIRNGVRRADWYRCLYTDIHRLYSFPEYHLQANHLWENGCALMIGGLFFGEKNFA